MMSGQGRPLARDNGLSAARGRGDYFWRPAAIRRLIGLARDGEAWVTIGLVFYPNAAQRQRAARAACEIFRRHADDDDRRARAAAIRRHNWNKPRGFGRHALTRRRRRRIEIAMPHERIDPWAGLGECFR